MGRNKLGLCFDRRRQMQAKTSLRLETLHFVSSRPLGLALYRRCSRISSCPCVEAYASTERAFPNREDFVFPYPVLQYPSGSSGKHMLSCFTCSWCLLMCWVVGILVQRFQSQVA